MNRSPSHPTRGAFRRLLANTGAIAAVEFAMTAPVLIMLYVGGFQLMDVISAYRKVTVTARTLADLTSRNERITPAEADAILGGARQVMTPYSTASSTLVLAELAIDHDRNVRVMWSRPAATEISVGDINLPEALRIADTHVIYSRMVFRYTPVFGGSLIGPMTLSDHIFMNPRRSPSVCLNTGTVSAPVCEGEGTSG